MGRPERYSTSFAFFEGLYEAGVSHVFVNLGSDHPAIMEALAHGAYLEGVNFPRVITCPHEMVAMCMADGFARLTGKPQCVLVHVDVGTQMLGCAMHNASVARCPVFVFAGLSPFTLEGEMRGSHRLRYTLDSDKFNMPVHYIPASYRYRSDAETALRQLNTYISQSSKYSNLLSQEPYASRWKSLADSHQQRLHHLAQLAAQPEDTSVSPSTSYLCAQLRKTCPNDTIWCLETVTNAPFVYQQLQVDKPGHLINAGGGGLGWSGGATIGVKLASDWLAGGEGKGSFVTEIVGDGTYMFGVPGTVYWIARRYSLPTLTVVLSNKGWNAPRVSLELVHPTGYGSAVSNKELNISFDPTPDYSGIAKAAAGGNAWAGVASTVEELSRLLPEAVENVQQGISAILEVRLAGSW